METDTTHPATTTDNGHHKVSEKMSQDLEGQTTPGGWVDPYGPAPGVIGWIKLYWHDVLAFIFLGVLALGFLLWSPVPYRRYFAITNQPTISNSDVLNAEFAHPKVNQIIHIIADAMVAVFTPIITIVLLNLLGIGIFDGPGTRTLKAHRRGSCFMRRGSFWNVSNGCIGVIYAVMTGAVLQIIIKIAIPGLRPHFLTVCDPQLNNDQIQGLGYRKLYFNAEVCRDHANPDRAKKIANAMQSFPSGHATAAFAGLFYLSLYLNAHLKIFANYHGSYWKLLAFVGPILAATLMAGSLFLDMSHNWYDILAGSLMGAAVATLSYRMVFASVWDFRWNHVPLIRGSKRGKEETMGLCYSAREMHEWSGGCGTRRAGWGVGRGYVCGAPGDSTAFGVTSLSPTVIREMYGNSLHHGIPTVGGATGTASHRHDGTRLRAEDNVELNQEAHLRA